MPRGGPRSIHERERDRQRHRERDSNRLIVALVNRPLDDGIVDDWAIDYALRGWERHAARLSREKLDEAVREGIRRGIGSPELAGLLLLHEREVERIRTRLRRQAERAQEAVPA
jgi:hypothetical protein